MRVNDKSCGERNSVTKHNYNRDWYNKNYISYAPKSVDVDTTQCVQ